jgi:predicted amidohydrolase YtcJ
MNPEPILFRGGTIRTMLDDAVPPAILVASGKIVAIGDESECLQRASGAARIVELDGRTLMPGFVDAHMHMLLHGQRLDWADLSGARSIDDLVKLLNAWAANNPAAPAIRGYGYDQTLLKEQRHPTDEDLNRVSRDKPILIQQISGHGFVVNSRVMQFNGITRETETPAGGRMDRYEDGSPNGLFFDAACDLLTGSEGVKIENHGPNFHLPITAAEQHKLMRLSQESFLAAGVTAVCDAQVTDLELGAYLSARDEGELILKSQLLMLSSHLDHLRSVGLTSSLGDSRLQILGVKFYADGSVLARTACLGDCCGGHAGDHRDGYLYHEPDELIGLLRQAHRLGLRTATHAQGTEPIAIVLDAVRGARNEISRPGVLHRIEHCGFPTDPQISEMRELGIVPVPQPLQVHQRADALMDEYGLPGGRFYPYGSFARAGIGTIVSSDAPVTDPAPLQSAWAAITRRTSSGGLAGTEDQKITREQALAGITRTPANLLGREGDGRIELGSDADLVLLDGDPFTAPVERLGEINATETWIDGQAVWTRQQGVIGGWAATDC